MSKITREELARKKRVALYKKIIIYGLFALTLTSIMISFILLYKVHKLEKRLDYLMSDTGGNYLTYRSSKEALSGNKYAEGTPFDQPVKSVLGNTKVNTSQVKNTAEQARSVEADAADEALEKVTEETENVGEAEAGMAEGASDDEKQQDMKRVYLTFDDGPSIYTGQILDILEANDVKATFFVIGKDENYYDYYKRIVDDGHTIGMHSFTHKYDELYASTESFGDEIERLQKLIYDVTGVESTIFRFPGGSSNNVSPLPIENYIAYLNEHGINYYDWNALSGDAVNGSLSPEQLVNNIMKDVRNNKDSVVLMHDLQTVHATVESLQLLIDTLKSEGYEILPIDENTPLIQHVSCNSLDE